MLDVIDGCLQVGSVLGCVVIGPVHGGAEAETELAVACAFNS